MKNKNIIIYLILIAIIIVLLFRVNNIKKQNNSIGYQSFDTIYVDKPYIVEKPYKVIEKPKLVTVYKTDTVYVDAIKLIRDTVFMKDTLRVFVNGNKYDYLTDFLTSYPDNDKLIQMKLDDKALSLTTLTTEGVTLNQLFNINTEVREYNLVNNALSSKRKPFIKRFDPFLQFTVRPFNNLYDLDLGIKYNTSKIKYEIGLNTFYYPRFNNDLRFDMFLRVNYIF